ncbi:MAG: pyruvate formate lyase family protein, partial [Anaerolineae bacterium]
MTERIARLREQSREATPTVSTERAELLTAFYKQNQELLSEPVRRAMAFRYLMEHKTIYIGDGELIVGEKGPAPKAAPTYPELCCHTLEDLEVLDSREKIAFSVSDEARKVYGETIIPFWRGRSMRDLIFQKMTDEWNAAYEAGVFTEFMEQRSPGHTVLDDKIYHKGMVDFNRDIQRSMEGLDYLN